jgi:hypothetical protein
MSAITGLLKANYSLEDEGGDMNARRITFILSLKILYWIDMYANSVWSTFVCSYSESTY